MVREHCALHQVSEVCLMVSVSKRLIADVGTCVCLLISAVLLRTGEKEYRLQFLRAGPSGITKQSPVLTATNSAVSCCR